MALNRCMICGDAVRPQQWVCAHCEEAYGLAILFEQWPMWAKALADEAQKGLV